MYQKSKYLIFQKIKFTTDHADIKTVSVHLIEYHAVKITEIQNRFEKTIYIYTFDLIFVQICKSWRFHDRVLDNSSVHATRNYVFRTLKTHKNTNKII